MADSDPIFIGVNLPAHQNISNQLVVDAALTQGYDLITSLITSHVYRKKVQALYASSEPDPEIPSPIGLDLLVFPGSHVSNTIALCAPWAELDSKDSRIADLSYKVIEQEMGYAKFCGLPYVVIEGPKRRTHLARYAHSLSRLLRKFPELKVMVHTTFTEDFKDGQPPPDLLSTWEVWDGIRVLSGHPPNLGLTLEVHRYRIPEFVVSRWLCEPVMMLVLGESHAFVANPKNYPVLPKHTQVLIHRLAALRPFFLIKENFSTHKLIKFNGGDDACLIYLRNMLSKRDSRLSYASQQSRASRHVDAEIINIHEHGVRPTSTCSSGDSSLDSVESCCCERYADVLETPLQPLVNSLDSGIYEVFETDVTKYNLYYRAIISALKTLLSQSELRKQDSLSSPLTIAILGAGRGAIVERVIDAVVATRAASSREIKIYAVEKHTGPVAYLFARKSGEPAWDPVEVVRADVRYWTPETPVHIAISEFLGSFGDNELSPECLTHFERSPRILASDGIMIPSSYTAYAAPIYSPQLWAKARVHSDKGLETPYVVCLHQAERLDEPQPVWSFTHPSTSRFTSRKNAKLSFTAKSRSRVYGIAGYFEAVLFGDIKLSTLPSSATLGLTSWFPMMFPITQPIDVLQDSVIEISMYRERSQRRIWYEWAVETQYRRARTGVSVVHNIEGHAQAMQL